mmetsp:Transcript_6523/g.14221  ORF Transcript_6523/g.14221 Transcript_6523/m.14221 type:complete len:266 (-) Transcript_6523:1178-1975(-)
MLSSKIGVFPNWTQGTSFASSSRGGGVPSNSAATSKDVVVFDSVMLMVKLSSEVMSSEVTSVPSAKVKTLFFLSPVSVALTPSAPEGNDSSDDSSVSPKPMLEGKSDDVATTSPPDTSMSVLSPSISPSTALTIKSSPSGLSATVPLSRLSATIDGGAASVPVPMVSTCLCSNSSARRRSFSSSLRFFSSFTASHSNRSFSSCASRSARSSTLYPRNGSRESYSSPSFNDCRFHGCCWKEFIHRTLPALVSAIRVSMTRGSSPLP